MSYSFPDLSSSKFASIYLKCCLFPWPFHRIWVVSRKFPVSIRIGGELALRDRFEWDCDHHHLFQYVSRLGAIRPSGRFPRSLRAGTAQISNADELSLSGTRLSHVTPKITLVAAQPETLPAAIIPDERNLLYSARTCVPRIYGFYLSSGELFFAHCCAER